MSKRRQQPLRATSIEVIDLFRGGMKQQDIADKMGMKYPRVAGIIWRARKRGDMDSRRDSMSPEKQLEAQLRRPPMLIGAPKDAIKNVMTIESFNHMTDMAIK